MHKLMTLEEARVIISKWNRNKKRYIKFQEHTPPLIVEQYMTATALVAEAKVAALFLSAVLDYKCSTHNGSHCCDTFFTYFENFLNKIKVDKV